MEVTFYCDFINEDINRRAPSSPTAMDTSNVSDIMLSA